MRIQSAEDWATRLSFAAESGVCSWVGIAIGPRSDEGVVRVNGTLLQAGRALAMLAPTYKLDRVLGFVGSLPSVKVLEVMCFETHAEMAAAMARANGLHSSGLLPLGGVAGDYTRLLTVPFVGRRHAMFDVSAVASVELHQWRIYGRRDRCRLGA